MQLSGTFQIVDWQESTQQSFDDDSKLNQAKVKQSYSGDFQGNSEVNYLMHYNKDGSAEFNGFEYFSGTIKGQPCTLVLKHNGRFENGVASSQFVISDAQGFDDLAGKTGQFKSTEGGQAQYQIDK